MGENKIANKYLLVKKIGSGSFGDVYLAFNKSEPNELVAVKMERQDIARSQLNYEYKLYQYLNQGQSTLGIPSVIYWGLYGSYNVMVMDLLGPSLEDLFNFCGRKFTLKTTLMLIDQCIKRIQFIHSKDFIHRDIKPDNFVMGRNERSNTVYTIDFGLAKKYRDGRTKKHIEYNEDKNLVGTVRYASINNHLGREQSRRDDMESLAYMFIYFMKGNLPWQGIKGTTKKDKYMKILLKKQSSINNELCQGLPPEFEKFLSISRSLKFEEEPDYLSMRKLFWSIAKRENIQFDGEFDWIHYKNQK
ncbi:casein kinase, putative [Entamoeba histolytica HM-1:IMSS-B]|uniref:non-specific serine/threonine protein kinase n=6 Tax=Entamoeba histolytica TaxID=5759 RepID=C4LTQ1_ENTH1|nr:casein kinase, putative [Entamoeba histolytica HM-1:IMSS]EMD49813.1 casein kinase, putative [Entamoeba histolytica KU27]EMH74719.1 casein kinase, putative [Entamoeba histolytica HM-1:IMSS-B]EMS12700.1 casein kinase, putative [Entamoeba histolytica HM-3:IMSS]ENY60313.1 casein kinase, putative [Entamoeba histolytica HM-1:IMSS-A]GAT91953.1 casein kinase putative [Entamoeba histolytica]|eukprot:XP_657192.1 casein kinase, putative [Entamoeba histolytica HM-1:IMSS]